jgi:hypothetical protein
MPAVSGWVTLTHANPGSYPKAAMQNHYAVNFRDEFNGSGARC